jgi:hypothetical protein
VPKLWIQFLLYTLQELGGYITKSGRSITGQFADARPGWRHTAIVGGLGVLEEARYITVERGRTETSIHAIRINPKGSDLLERQGEKIRQAIEDGIEPDSEFVKSGHNKNWVPHSASLGMRQAVPLGRWPLAGNRQVRS